MKTNDGKRLVRKPEKHIRHLVLNARDLPSHLAFDLALETGSSVGNATSLALLHHSLAFTSIRRAGQRTSAEPPECREVTAMVNLSPLHPAKKKKKKKKKRKKKEEKSKDIPVVNEGSDSTPYCFG